MAQHATGGFGVTAWDEQSYEELAGGAKLTRASVAQDFSGDLEATGTWEFLMCYREDGTADYVGLARIAGRIDGRSGSFVLQTSGSYDGSDARSAWQVVPGSGTDELRTLRGAGTAVAPHGPSGTFELDYELD